MEYEELVERYKHACLALGKDDNLKRVPDSKSELINKIGELTFEWIHDRCM